MEHSGRVLDSRPRGRGFEPHRRHCVVSLSKSINPSLVLVQPRMTCPFIIERLLMGGKESNQTKQFKSKSTGCFYICSFTIIGYDEFESQFPDTKPEICNSSVIVHHILEYNCLQFNLSLLPDPLDRCR